MSNSIDPKAHDLKLASVWTEIYKARQHLSMNASTLLRLAGAKYYYRGRQRVTDMKLDEAMTILTEDAMYIAEYKAEHGYTEHHADYDYHGTDWSEYKGRVATRENERPAEYLTKHHELQTKLAELEVERTQLEVEYTGWSRFFLVTSSNGHIHGSMYCSTCRPTTTYGWLPYLSGKTEAEAIESFGQAAECLCSVCFPDAPVLKKDGNLTTKQRDALLKGETPAAKATDHCPGSGRQAIEPTRTGYAAGNWGTCPHCGDHVAFGSRYSRKVRKHKPKAA